MLWLFAVLAIFLATATADCGRRAQDNNWRIVNGAFAEENQWPWMAHLQIRLADEDAFLVCGGALIDNSTVLTAAHCLPGVKTDGIIVTVGQTNALGQWNWSNKYIAMEQRQHEDYFHSFLGKDLMILKLHRPVPNAQTICLPKPGEEFPPGTKCYLSGWGHTEEGKTSRHLRYADMILLDNEDCKAMREQTSILPEQVCAGGDSIRNGCMGDSGGPLQCQRGDGSWVAAGVVSYGDKECGKIGRPGVYTRVTHYLDWIEKNRGPLKYDYSSLNIPSQ